MHRAINFAASEKDLKVIDTQLNDSIALACEDDWDIESYSEISKYLTSLIKCDYVELSCLDITQAGGADVAERYRSFHPDGMLVLISDNTVSPLVYMKPGIMACSLLLKPVNSNDAKNCFCDVLKTYVEREQGARSSNDKKFAITLKEGTSYYPYDRILYFEAREKKLFLNTANSEIGFYGTLDSLIEELPPTFLRCHRGFIVNSSKIVKVMLSENTIYLTDDAFVPLSRGYKSAIKEALER